METSSSQLAEVAIVAIIDSSETQDTISSSMPVSTPQNEAIGKGL